MNGWMALFLVLGFSFASSGWGSGMKAEPELTVMTFNIRFGTASDGENAWPNRKEAVFALIRDQKPDVLGLQEALGFQIEEILAAVPGYRVFGVGRDDGVSAGEYSPVLYRADRFGILEAGTKWISDTPDVVGSKGPGANLPRIFTWVKFQDKAGSPFLFLNTHFDHQSAAARLMGAQQLAAFGARFPGLPVVVTGDFNAGLESEPILHFLSSGFTAAKPEVGPFGTFTGFRVGSVDGEMIDHVFYDRRWSLESVLIDRRVVDGRYPSDHFPVVARLSRRVD